ncbi:predicted protein [Arabidopsis lyrata subsp. lyrata]|uniref:Predicted protein n=1 Tax=Arabidopsis lyrata subsp. lyrata TaxID=81972 RepID=D7LA94_ARALL|nr:predicted protein [Arabidopsis lyrata subsp. lyrata]
MQQRKPTASRPSGTPWSLTLLKMDVGRAASRSDLSTVRDALEVSAEMVKKDANNVSDYVQRHLNILAIN